MIDFTRAFDSAWERMVIILFRPFDLGKWCVIGFSAFLAGLLLGGNGSNGSAFSNLSNLEKPFSNRMASPALPSLDMGQINANWPQSLPELPMAVMILVLVLVLPIVLAFALFLVWLGVRGQFLLLDNIVRNRAEISWPWQNYARQANGLFLFYVLLRIVAFVAIMPILLVGFFLGLPFWRHHRWPEGGEVVNFVILGLIYFLLVLVLDCLLFIYREFGFPLIFRNGLTALAAFRESMGLIGRFPVSIAIFILLRLALSLAVVVLSLITCCFCCIGALPYVGTVVLLPALIYVRCFTLDCLAQFGPQYDVWTVDVRATVPPAVSPPPPPG
jgi:hypothetical protein